MRPPHDGADRGQQAPARPRALDQGPLGQGRGLIEPGVAEQRLHRLHIQLARHHRQGPDRLDQRGREQRHGPAHRPGDSAAILHPSDQHPEWERTRLARRLLDGEGQAIEQLQQPRVV
ncbi:MAG: hypothetical protein ACI9K2_007488, partial [Myxococcota bacterium]